MFCRVAVPAFAATTSESGIQWQNFSEEAIQQSLSEGQVVFIDVTADWCWTCKLNEKLFLETDEVSSILNDNNVVALRADWLLPPG